ncbi:MAG: penicillin-binding protein 2 [Actinomycetes bacterium]
MSEGNSRFRLGVVGVAVLALFCALFARLWFLQVGDAASYQAQTAQNRVRLVKEPAIRGAIVDRNGVALVQNTLIDSITIQRNLTPEAQAITVKNLAKILELTPESVQTLLDSPNYSPYEPVPVAQHVAFEKLVYIQEHPELFPGVSAERQSLREYPVRTDLFGNPPVGAHLLGYVASINKQEYEIRKSQGYSQIDLIGKEGVEQLFESELRGSPRVRKLEVDSLGRLVGVASETPPTPGNDVQLTIDANIQKVAEDSLNQGMTQARNYQDIGYKAGFRQYKASGGAVVVLDTSNGDIVALASAPTFDISKFTNGIPADEYARLTGPDSNNPLIDRAVQGQYAPGSTFKAFTSYSALRDALPLPNDGGTYDDTFTFYDKGFIRFGVTGKEQEFQNSGRQANGIVDLHRALTVSSDTYFYNLGLLYWQDFGKGNERNPDLNQPEYGLQKTARLFGFGSATGSGLPGEQPGRVPDLAFKRSVNKDSTDPSTQIWLPGDSMNLAVGQGDTLVTPLQLAAAYGALGNGGKLFQPRLASRVLEGGSTLGVPKVVRDLPVQPAKDLKLNPDLVATIRAGLEGVICNPEGTASGAFDGYACGTVMGKTGTAQTGNGEDTSLFVGVSPSSVDPAGPPTHQYVVCVVVEQGGFGGSVSAPIARRIFDALLGDPNPPPVRTFPPKKD